MFALVQASDGAYKVFGSVYAVPASTAGVKTARFDGVAYYLGYTCPRHQVTVTAGVTVSGTLSVAVLDSVYVIDVYDNNVDQSKAAIRVCEALALAGKVYEELYRGTFDAAKYRPTTPLEDHSPLFAFCLDGFLIEIAYL